MTSTVMTGRRTKSSDRFMSESLRLDFDLRPGAEAQLPLCDYPLAFCQAAFDDRAVAFGPLDGDHAQLGSHVGLDHENVLAIGTGLHRSGGHDQGVVLVVERDPYVDELAGPESVLGVLELRPQLDGPGARIDGVIDEDQRSGGCGLSRAGGQRLDRERPRGHVVANGAELLLRHGEVHVDRVDLVDHYQGKRIVRLDEVSHLDLDFSWVAVDRRADRAVLEIELCVVERGAAPLRDALRRLGGGAYLRVRFLRDEILREQLLVATLLRAGLIFLGRVAHEVRVCLAQRRFVRTRIDPEQDVPVRDFFPFFEADLDDLAVDARFYRHRRKSLDVADCEEAKRHDFLQDRR